MAKRKDKKRRHQLKKSRRGQTSRKQQKSSVSLPSDSDDDDVSNGPDIVFMQASRDAPIAQDGYRIVGPAQAMMDYAKPLMDNLPSDEPPSERQLNNVLEMTQELWTLAVLRRREPEKFGKAKRKAVRRLDMPNVEGFLDMMLDRFEQMFPEVGREPSFYIKERVIDIEEFEPFDESTLRISEERIPPTEDERKLGETLREIDPEKDEDELLEWKGEVVGHYAEWCVVKGMPEDVVEDFAYAVDCYIDFLSHYHGEVISAHTPTGATREFMRTFFIRKTWSPAQQKSVMPCALKLFMQYLDEKGIVSGTDRTRKTIESEQDTFLKNLKLYVDPSLGGKIVHLPKGTE